MPTAQMGSVYYHSGSIAWWRAYDGAVRLFADVGASLHTRALCMILRRNTRLPRGSAYLASSFMRVGRRRIIPGMYERARSSSSPVAALSRAVSCDKDSVYGVRAERNDTTVKALSYIGR